MTLEVENLLSIARTLINSTEMAIQRE